MYDNATTYVLARIVERVTGRTVDDLLRERLFDPTGVEDAKWDRLGSGDVFGFHGLHLTTEAVAAFGELLLREGRWNGEQLVAAEWVRAATTAHVTTEQSVDEPLAVDDGCGYGYQFWMSRGGFRGYGAYEQLCTVHPGHDLVVVLTAGDGPHGAAPGAVHDCLLPRLDGLEGPGDADDEVALLARTARLTLPLVEGAGPAGEVVSAVVDASPERSALPCGTPVALTATDDGWRLRGDDPLDPARSHRRSSDWDGVERDRLAAEVLEPFRAGRPVSFRPYDWSARSLAEPRPLSAAEVVVDVIGSAEKTLHANTGGRTGTPASKEWTSTAPRSVT